MDRPTRIVPPIRFISTAGDEASITVATALVEHLDALYDRLLDPRYGEAHAAGTLRTKHLDTIEKLLFRATEEMDQGAVQLSDGLRTQAALLIGQYGPLAAVAARPDMAGQSSQAAL
ncbi:hypothetical protein [Inquilinus limosus]|uniref:Uncharacterized protein n=1 Tax=Inquilinus limosus MP06 TaxID=1398085 RepID=A0A0A0D270_9PROT|nr:hypothetical protein [Inquilinus limosus]KGM31968.1 hypothetical protein P409_24150 [Inquilinus limosus MP06]